MSRRYTDRDREGGNRRTGRSVPANGRPGSGEGPEAGEQAHKNSAGSMPPTVTRSNGIPQEGQGPIWRSAGHEYEQAAHDKGEAIV